MPIWPGYFDRAKPCIDIVVVGGSGSPGVVSAVVDTGFSGFIHMPESLAALHAPQPLTTTTGTLADGRRVVFRTALVEVRFAKRSAQGAALLVPSEGPCLIGIDFLRKFQMTLVMTNRQLWLMDEAQFEDIAIRSGAARRVSGGLATD
jgi:clan AA aspartic protease